MTSDNAQRRPGDGHGARLLIDGQWIAARR